MWTLHCQFKRLFYLNLNWEDATAQVSCRQLPEDFNSVMAIRLCVCTPSNLIKMLQTGCKRHTNCETKCKRGSGCRRQARTDTVDEMWEQLRCCSLRPPPQQHLNAVRIGGGEYGCLHLYSKKMNSADKQTANTCGPANIPRLTYRHVSNSDTQKTRLTVEIFSSFEVDLTILY